MARTGPKTGAGSNPAFLLIAFRGVTMNSVHPEGRKCRAVADWDNPTLTAIGSDNVQPPVACRPTDLFSGEIANNE
jgi:hypothetical protein